MHTVFYYNCTFTKILTAYFPGKFTLKKELMDNNLLMLSLYYSKIIQ